MGDPTRDALHQLIVEATACLHDGRLDRAETIANGILASAPETVAALDILARVRLQQRNAVDALTIVKRGLAVSPDNPVLTRLAQRALSELNRQAQVEVQRAAIVKAEALIAKGNYGAASELLVATPIQPRTALTRQFLTLLAASGHLEKALDHLDGRDDFDDFARSLLRADLAYAAGDVGAALAIVTRPGDGQQPNAEVLRRAMHWSATLGRLDAAADWAERFGAALPDAEFVQAASIIAQRLDHAGRNARGMAVRRLGCELARLVADGSGASAVFNLHMQMFDISAAESAARRLARDGAERDELLAHAEALRSRAEYMEVLRLAEIESDARPADLTFFVRGAINTHLGRAIWSEEPEIAQLVFGVALRLARDAGLGVRVIGAGKGLVLPPELADVPSVLSYLTIGGRDALHTKMGPLTGTILLDQKGYAGWATAADTPLTGLPLQDVDPEMAMGWIESERQSRRKNNTSKLPQAERTPIDFTGPAVLVALQKPSDSVMAHARIDFFALLPAVAERFAGTGTMVIVKRHPLCSDPRVAALLRKMLKQPHVRLSKASIHDLFEAVQAVYVVNSGVGAEALLYGKPVHVCGKADYRHACHEVSTVQDILDCRDPFTPPLPQAEIARYMWWYTHVNHVWMADPGALDTALDRMLIQPALRRRMGR